MSASDPLDQIAERVERLLVRHEELRRTNGLLGTQLDTVTRERDALRQRLEAAVSRIDAVLEQLPTGPCAPDAAAPDAAGHGEHGDHGGHGSHEGGHPP